MDRKTVYRVEYTNLWPITACITKYKMVLGEFTSLYHLKKTCDNPPPPHATMCLREIAIQCANILSAKQARTKRGNIFCLRFLRC